MATNRMKLVALSFALVIVCSVVPGVESPVAITRVATVDQIQLSAVVWSDNFEDHDISDWTIYGLNGTTLPFDVVPGNFSAEDGVLRANGTELAWSIAVRNSSVAYGTWMFDVDVTETYGHDIVIVFLQLVWNLEVWGIDGYFIRIWTGDQPRLQAATSYASGSPIGRSLEWWEPYYYEEGFLGWKNFIITREPDGQFYVYINGTLALSHKDNRHTSCEEFHFGTNPGPAIDNIIVSDSVDYDAAPPEWEPVPTDQFIVLGDDFNYDIDASDFSGLDTATWAVNDTTNFAIDSDGVITNLVDLELGTYGLNVSVSDTGGFTNSTTFTVIVESPDAPPPPDITLYLILGGAGIVIVALVVLFMRKR